MTSSKKEALVIAIRTKGYSPYRLKDSLLPVSGAFFWNESGELEHRDLEERIGFKK